MAESSLSTRVWDRAKIVCWSPYKTFSKTYTCLLGLCLFLPQYCVVAPWPPDLAPDLPPARPPDMTYPEAFLTLLRG